MDISVVIPLYNEEESIRKLYDWITRVMKENGFSYEIIFVNDGSTDHSWDVIEGLATQDTCVHGIKFRRNYGKSPALYCGFEQVRGDVVITMDADLQDSPDEIPELYRMIREDGYDLVSGYNRHQVFLRGENINLTQAEYRIVALLGQYSGKVLTYDFIMKELWGPRAGRDNRILRVNMANIRRKIEKNPAKPEYLLHRDWRGYRIATNKVYKKFMVPGTIN